MTMRISRAGLELSLALLLASAGAAMAQEAKDAPVPETAPEPVARLQGSPVINLPSADVPGPRTLQLLFTHRFSGSVQESDIHSLFSFDSGADVNMGLSYVPVKNLEVGFYRAKSLEDYEVHIKYAILGGSSPVHVAVRVGGDWRTSEIYTAKHFSFFAQTVAGVTIAERVHVTVVPTYVTRAVGQLEFKPFPVHDDVWNVPVALSVAVTRSINVQGELMPRTHSPATGWIVAVEKTLPKHRFSFTAGNLREVTVDQFVASDFKNQPRSNIYLGFNIVRQWKL
jgi:hypothetical protein